MRLGHCHARADTPDRVVRRGPFFADLQDVGGRQAGLVAPILFAAEGIRIARVRVVRQRRDITRHHREDTMRFRNSIGATALAATLLMTNGEASAFDDTKYPDLKGQWQGAGPRGLLAGGAGGARYDDSKPPALTPSLGQEPPLTAEYQAIYDANLDDMTKGGQGIVPTHTCLARGMPQVMLPFSPMEFVVTPDTTYILMERDQDFYRHIYTDGRDFPANMAEEPLFLGYSIGTWLDEDGDGRYEYPEWRETICVEGNQHVLVGKEYYFLSADGLLMPAKKNQAPPDLRYFHLSKSSVSSLPRGVPWLTEPRSVPFC
jgi:hypothetical protein